MGSRARVERGSIPTQSARIMMHVISSAKKKHNCWPVLLQQGRYPGRLVNSFRPYSFHGSSSLIFYSFLSETPRTLSARGSRSLLAPTPMSGLFEPHLERGCRALLSSHRCLHPIEHDDKSCFSFTVCLFFFLRSANVADMLYTEPRRLWSLVRRRQRFRIRRACQQQIPSGLHSCLVATGFLSVL